MSRFVRTALFVVVTVAAVTARALHAQSIGAVAGVVIGEESGEALAGVDIVAYTAADSSVTAHTVSAKDGRFLLTGIRPGAYFVRLSMVGRATSNTAPFRVAPGQTVDLGTLRLAVSPIPMDSLTVAAARPPVTYEVDRTVYDVAAMGLGDAGVVSDALVGIPGLEVGMNGEISVRGRTPQIYINGEPAPYSGQSLAMFLEQFPSELIERIEIIRNPGASFAAEGAGGIVNIVLRRGAELGSSGSLFVGGGTRGRMRGGGQATYDKGPVTLEGNATVSGSRVRSSSFDLRENLLANPTTFTRRDGSHLSSSLGLGAGARARYRISERTSLTLSGQLGRSGHDRDGRTTTTWLDEARTPTLSYGEHSTADDHGLAGNAGVRFRHLWQPRRHELNVDVTWARNTNDASQAIDAATRDLAAGVVLPPALTEQATRDANLTARASVDYRRPWGEGGQLRVGYRADLQRTDDRRSLLQVADPDSGDGVETRDAYVHTRRLSSAYAEASRTVGRISVQGGVRLERTDMTLDVPGVGRFGNGYTDVFPSATVSFGSRRGSRLRLSYSRRISRPDVGILNPRNRSTDPLNRSVGNPDIRPQLTHRLSLDGSLTLGHFMLGTSPYWEEVANGWAPITTVDSEGVSTRTYENLVSEQSYGVSVLLNAHTRSGWQANVFLNGRRHIRDASNLEARYSGAATLWSGQLLAVRRMKSGMTLMGRFSYTAPVDLPQGRTSGREQADFIFRYRFLDRRASLSASLVDPFDLARRSSTNTGDVSYVQIARSSQTLRSASFSFSYTFGGRGRMRQP